MKKLVILILLFNISEVSAAKRPTTKDDVRYRTSFGRCPSQAAGKLTLNLVKAFELNKSLRDVKLKILHEKLKEKHFISNYSVKYEPSQKLLSFSYQCPEALMKVQVYKDEGEESYEAILVDDGKLFDPTYEVLLRADKKLTKELPYLALPVGDMDSEIQKKIARIIGDLSPQFRSNMSEVILNDLKELTIILSIKGHPSSVFLGKDNWKDKISKLKKIVRYVDKKKRIPTIINLTNAKKVVVKFNDKF